jgi:hypothetical protein
MTLKNLYEDTKRPRVPVPYLIGQALAILTILAFYTLVVYIGWNRLVAKIFELPTLTYLQTAGILVWLMFIRAMLFSNVRLSK